MAKLNLVQDVKKRAESLPHQRKEFEVNYRLYKVPNPSTPPIVILLCTLSPSPPPYETG